MTLAPGTTATVIPTLRYRGCRKMIDWLCGASGFDRRVYDPRKAEC